MSALLPVFVYLSVGDGLSSLAVSEQVCNRGCVSAPITLEKGVYILSLQAYCRPVKICQLPAWRIQC